MKPALASVYGLPLLLLASILLLAGCVGSGDGLGSEASCPGRADLSSISFYLESIRGGDQ